MDNIEKLVRERRSLRTFDGRALTAEDKAKLLEGATVEEIEDKLLGNTCGRRPTSCTDQLAKAVRAAYNSL